MAADQRAIGRGSDRKRDAQQNRGTSDNTAHVQQEGFDRRALPAPICV